MATLIIGGNTFTKCEHALTIGGKEVFRLRQRGGDGQLVADFDLCDAAGRSIAKVAKNNIVHAAAGTTVRNGPSFSEVIDSSGTVLGRAEEVSLEVVRLTGCFGQPGMVVEAGPDHLQLPGGGLGLCFGCPVLKAAGWPSPSAQVASTTHPRSLRRRRHHRRGARSCATSSPPASRRSRTARSGSLGRPAAEASQSLLRHARGKLGPID